MRTEPKFKEELGLVNPDDLHLKQVIKKKILNIINVYAKIIGNEWTRMYLNLNLITVEKKYVKGKYQVFFIKTTSNFYGFIQDKLPRLSLSKNLSFHSKKYEILQNNAKIEFTRFFQVLKKIQWKVI